MASRPLLKDCLKTLNFTGLGPYKHTLGQNVRKYITFLIIYGSCLDVISSCIFEWKGMDSKEDVLIAIIMIQLVFKTFVLPINCKETRSLIENINKFWNLEKFGLENREKLNVFFSNVATFIKCVLTFILVLVFAFTVKPLFKNGNNLPYSSLLFNSKTAFSKTVGIIGQCLAMTVIAFNQIVIDGLFTAFVTNIICELKMIKIGVNKISIDGNVQGADKIALDELKELIRHHNFILTTIRQFKRLYSPLLLIIFAINMFTIVACLICMITSGFKLSDMPAVCTFGTTAFFYVTQLFVYCAPGSKLISESMEISEVVYNTDWWIKTQPELRRAYVMIIQRANKPEMLTAGGFMNVNLEGFTKILNTTFSFLTFVQAVMKEKTS